MSDLLIHRIPGEDITFLTGTWKKGSPKKDFDGWFVTNLDKSENHIFVDTGTGYKEPQLNEISNVVYTESEYKRILKSFQTQFESRGIKKAIFSRIEKIQIEISSIKTLVEKLSEQYPHAFVYALSSDELGTWIGATPEVLLKSSHNHFETMSLAGTKLTATESWTSKELDEQQIVTDYILSNIESITDQVETNGQNTVKAGAVYHLQTKIIGDLKNSSAWDLAQVLHPTPAVCGVPKDKALELIQVTEQHNRGLYTGVIGRMTSSSAELFVNLRCMQVAKEAVYLYVGGGITEASNIDKEWIETCNKSKTLANVLIS